jgi:hypothetical protein
LPYLLKLKNHLHAIPFHYRINADRDWMTDFIAVDVNGHNAAKHIFTHVGCKTAGNGPLDKNKFPIGSNEFDAETVLFSLGSFFYIVFVSTRFLVILTAIVFYFQSYARRKGYERTENNN